MYAIVEKKNTPGAVAEMLVRYQGLVGEGREPGDLVTEIQPCGNSEPNTSGPPSKL